MTFYKIDHIEQGSANWHDWRNKVIGASEAHIIMGENRIISQQNLFDEKRGRRTPFKGNIFTRDGHFHEGFARHELCAIYDLEIEPIVVQDSKLPFLAASLDGMAKDGSEIVEIKCGLANYRNILLTKKIPTSHMAQLQHILMVTKHENMIYAAYRPNQEIILIRVERDDAFIRILREKEIRFVDKLFRSGHEIQSEFIGKKMNPRQNSKTLQNRLSNKISVWEHIDGKPYFYDGLHHHEGTKAGYYLLNKKKYYWDGDGWRI